MTAILRRAGTFDSTLTPQSFPAGKDVTRAGEHDTWEEESTVTEKEARSVTPLAMDYAEENASLRQQLAELQQSFVSSSPATHRKGAPWKAGGKGHRWIAREL